jgi:hypothetical protein
MRELQTHIFIVGLQIIFPVHHSIVERKFGHHPGALLQKGSMVSAVNILFVSAMLVDTNRRIPRITSFKYRLFPADTKDQFLRIKKLPHSDKACGPRSGPATIDVVLLWWRSDL